MLGGFLSSLVALTLNAFGSWAFAIAFIPYLYFDWLVRVLPGWIVVPSIERMVQLVSSLSLGPVDEVSKGIENALAIGLFLIGGTLFGVLVGVLVQRIRLGFPVFAWAAAGLLFVFTLLIETSPEIGHNTTPVEIVGQLALFGAWGYLIGLWTLAIIKQPAQNPAAGVDLTRRRMLLSLSASALIPVAVYLASGWVSLKSAAVVLISKPVITKTPIAGFQTPVPKQTEIQTIPVISETPTLTSTQVSTPAGRSDYEPDTRAARLPDPVGGDGRLLPAPGTRVELTENRHFYRVDINSDAPVIDPAAWQLSLAGLVDKLLTLTLDEIRQRPAVDEIATLSCISNTLGAKLISNTRWTGIRLKDLLVEAGLKPAGVSLHIDSLDGYYETAQLAEVMDDRTILVYAMNGETLLPEHGFPLRLFIPGHYGMRQPKWISRLTVIDSLGTGFWSDRGWSKVARVNTMSSIDTASASLLDAESHTVPLGGIAFAGDRGINRVEIQMDNGPWTEASLRKPPLSALSWVQWRANVPYVAGAHTFRVRGTDGTGTLQPSPIGDMYPSGATGLTWLDVTF